MSHVLDRLNPDSFVGRIVLTAVVLKRHPSHPVRAIRSYRFAKDRLARAEQWARAHPGMVGRLDARTGEMKWVCEERMANVGECYEDKL